MAIVGLPIYANGFANDINGFPIVIDGKANDVAA